MKGGRRVKLCVRGKEGGGGGLKEWGFKRLEKKMCVYSGYRAFQESRREKSGDGES